VIIDVSKIGNSKGIRIPKSVLKECGIRNKVKLEVIAKNIILKPVTTRFGWDKAFKEMRQNDDDVLIIPDEIDLQNDEWEW